MEKLNLNGYIPIHGSYKESREGFAYDRELDRYTCEKGHHLEHRQLDKLGGYVKKRYLSSKKVCDKCPQRKTCVGRRGYKEISHTIYKNQYDDMIEKLKSEEGQRSYALRMQTVEPVFGTLQQYYGMRWINTRGIDLANKVMIMAASALNLKKNRPKTAKNQFFKLF